MARDNSRLRTFLLACGLAALAMGTAAQLLAPPHPDALLTWLQTTIIPGAIFLLLVVNRGDGVGLLGVTCGLLYLEAVLTAALYTIGIAFAILLPMMGIGLVQPHVHGRRAALVYVGAAGASTIAVALAALSVPSNPLDEPWLAVAGFGFLAAFALGLMWRAGERSMLALEAAGRELDARARAESELTRTGQALTTLIRSSPVATMAIEADGTVSVWNPAAEALFGWTDAEVAGRRLPEAMVEDGGELRRGIERAMAGATVQGDRVHSRRKDGAELIVEVHAARRDDASGGSAGTIVQITDVTDRAALEAQLLQAQKMEAIGQLAGGIAHDINNTLTAVGGFAELIEAAADDQLIRDDARTITSAVGRGRQLTRQLLAFAGRSILQPAILEVNAFISSIEPMLVRLLGPGIDLVITHEIGPSCIRVDPAQFEQAIVNLAANARDAMPDGGSMRIATRRIAAADESSLGRVATVAVAVSDTGGGIPLEVQDQVFDPFFTTKAQGKGTGLGLAMVYGFVTQSGGEVELRSARGAGTTIEIRLPEVAAEDLAAPAAGDGSLVGDETILLIEDEAPVAELARQVLQAFGYRVLVALSPGSGIEQARSFVGPIQLVLSDVIMPGMLGPDVVRAILEIHPEARVLYASGYTADAIAERGILPDGVDLIEKPYRTRELALRVRAILDRPRQGESNGRDDGRGNRESAAGFSPS